MPDRILAIRRVDFEQLVDKVESEQRHLHPIPESAAEELEVIKEETNGDKVLEYDNHTSINHQSLLL
jgi:hypothetical protein